MKLKIEKHAYKDIFLKASIVGISRSEFISEMIRYFFGDDAFLPRQKEILLEIFEEIGFNSTRDSSPNEIETLVDFDLPVEIFSDLCAIANLLKVEPDILISDFINALYGYRGSTTFELLVKISGGLSRFDPVRAP